jgi:hypothetical protein
MEDRPASIELAIPDTVPPGRRAVELLRVWQAAGRLHCSCKFGNWARSETVEEGQAWGRVLADVVRQLADGLQQRTGVQPGETVSRILHALEGELADPEPGARWRRGRTKKGIGDE